MDPKGKIRYAVVGVGSIAQDAILPAFAHATNSELTALVSGDDAKREELGRRYGCPTYTYEQFEECLASRTVDAAYIALPNHMHREYAERAAREGVHVLCEKPLGGNEEDCRKIIAAFRTAGLKLMTAYRLHFEPANLEAIRICHSGKLGELRLFHSVFCQQVAEGNVRLKEPFEQGGGPLFDLGVYCINASRYLFRSEPVEVSAYRTSSRDPRFSTTEEMVSVMMRFPKDRLASFTVSFGAASVSQYTVVGTEGQLTADPAYDFSKELQLRVRTAAEAAELSFPKHDQFGAELLYFSDCIRENRDPEPSGEEGLIDVQIVEAAHRSSLEGRAVPLRLESRRNRPDPSQEISLPPVDPPELLNARMPSGAAKGS